MGQGVIAIIEDDYLLSLVMSKHLEREGFSTRSFSKAEDFLVFLASSPQIHAAILDVKLKGEMTGNVLSGLIPTSIPQIFCTGNSDITQLRLEEKPFIKAVLIKPIDLSELSGILLDLNID